MDDYRRRQADPAFQTVAARMRMRLSADPHLHSVADTNPSAFCALYDQEKSILLAEQAREEQRAELLAPDPPAEAPADWILQHLKSNALESGSEEDVLKVIKHMEGGEIDDRDE